MVHRDQRGLSLIIPATEVVVYCNVPLTYVVGEKKRYKYNVNNRLKTRHPLLLGTWVIFLEELVAEVPIK